LEIAGQDDLVKIPASCANIILEINNRNLTTFAVDLNNRCGSSRFCRGVSGNQRQWNQYGSRVCLAETQWFCRCSHRESLMRAADPKALLDKFRKNLADAG
jgi:hypothetical protein